MPRKTKQQTEVIELVLDLRRLKQQLAYTEHRIHNEDSTGVQDILLQVLDEIGKATVTIRAEEPGTRVTATAVHTASEVIDEPKLKKRLGHELWSKVTTLALDRKKLQDAMAQGLVDPNVVAQCAESVPRRPYVKLTERKT